MSSRTSVATRTNTERPIETIAKVVENLATTSDGAELADRLTRALVDHFGDRPNLIPEGDEAAGDLTGGEPMAVRAAVAYVAGMTDRFAFSQAVALLGWDPDKLPAGIGVTRRL